MAVNVKLSRRDATELSKMLANLADVLTHYTGGEMKDMSPTELRQTIGTLAVSRFGVPQAAREVVANKARDIAAAIRLGINVADERDNI